MSTNKVVLHVYDLSQGMASSFLSSMPGLTGGVDGIDGIWHTGVEVFGEEYFYGGGIQHMNHFSVIGQYGLSPKESIVLGYTKKTKQQLEQFLASIDNRFTPQTYNLLKNNCNNFSFEVHGFLLPANSSDSVNRIDFPANIIELPERFARTPIGQMLMPMWERLEREYLTHTLVPFNNTPPSTMGSTATSSSLSSNANTTTATAPVSNVTATQTSSSLSESSSDAFINVMLTSSDSEIKSRSIRVPINNPDTFTVKDLNQFLTSETGIAADDQRLIFQGQVLKDQSSKVIGGQISSLKIGQTIHLVPKPGAKVRSNESEMAAALRSMKSKNAANESQYTTAVKTLLKIIENIEEHPTEEKYRKINKSNPVFEKRICNVPGAPECMEALGFLEACEKTNEGVNCFYVLHPSAEAWEKLVSSKKDIQTAVSSLPTTQQAQQTQSVPPPSGFPGGMPGIPSIPGMPSMPGMPGGLPFGMDPATLMRDPRVQQIMQNPQMMQSILNHPMAQSMAAGDPMLQAQLQMLRQNPGLLSSILPGMQQQQQQQQQPGSNQNQNTNTNNGQGDGQMTEEEMIQEAIARSLREQ